MRSYPLPNQQRDTRRPIALPPDPKQKAESQQVPQVVRVNKEGYDTSKASMCAEPVKPQDDKEEWWDSKERK